MRVRGWLVQLGLVILAAVARPVQAQQAQGIVRGEVKDGASGVPIIGARVSVLGTALTTASGVEGKFTLRGVPAGSRELVVIAVGYASQRVPVEVTTGGDVTATVSMTASPVRLDEIVVTATGEQRSVELGHSIASVQADSVVTYSGGRSVTDLLEGKAAGVNVISSSGTVGAGTRIRIRGASSVSLSNDPILFVDGVRVAPLGTASLSVGTGGQAPSRLDDLVPEEIGDVQIVKGAAAASLYGTEGSSGVIQITTRRGRPGPTRWTASAEQGVLTDPKNYPDNYTSFRTGATTRATCLLTQVAAGTCTQDSVTKFNVLTNPGTSPIGSGYRQLYSLQASGGSDAVTYFVSGEFSGQTGTLKLNDGEQQRMALARGVSVGNLPDNVVTPNYLRKYGLRANMQVHLSSRADVEVSTGYGSSNLRLPQNDNNVLGILPSGYFGKGSATDTLSLLALAAPGQTVSNGGWGFFRPGEIFSLLRTQNVERFTGGVTTKYRPISFLNTHATIGYDITNRTDIQFDPTFLGPNFGTTPNGNKADNRTALKSYTVDLGASANYKLRPTIGGRTSVGGQFFKDVFYQNTALGQGLTPGSSDIDGAATLQASETTTDVRTLGGYFEQLLSLKERVFLTFGLRVDDNSAFGQNFNAIKYPKASLSYFISDEPFFPKGGFLTALRLRGAYGQAGRQPGATDGLTFVTPVTATVDGSSAAAITTGGIGVPGLKPERSKEFEMGFDASLLRDRVGMGLTYYNKITDDVLLSRVLPPSSGGPTTRVENLGSVRNYGAELNLNTTIPIGRSSFDLQVTASLLKNNLRTLGTDNNGNAIPPILLGNQRHQPNYPLGGYWDIPYTFADSNGDGIIAPSEVKLGSAPKFIGSVLPTRELSFRPTFVTWGGKIRLGAQFDYRGGNYLFNNTEAFRCTATGNNCRALHDPTTPLAEQAAAVARRSFGTTYGYVEKADFLKLREVSLTISAPPSLARLVRADAARLTIAGRNLWTTTKYSGADPEVQSAGQSNFVTQDFLTQPPVRTWVFRASFDF